MHSINAADQDWTTVTYITSMPQLRHCEATLDCVALSVPQPLVVVALCAKKLDCTPPVIHKIELENFFMKSLALIHMFKIYSSIDSHFKSFSYFYLFSVTNQTIKGKNKNNEFYTRTQNYQKRKKYI